MKVLQLARLKLPELVAEPGRPLELTPVVHPEHHDEVIRSWASRLGEREVVEVDISGELLPASERLLRSRLEREGSGGTAVVVRVRAPGTDLEAVARHPVLAAFDHLLTSAPVRPLSPRIRRLAELAAQVREALDEWYSARAVELGLRPEAWRALAPLLVGVHDPVECVEALNDLVEVQLAGVRAADQVSTVQRRILSRQLGGLSPGALLLLVERILGEAEVETRRRFGEIGPEVSIEEADADLTAADLWLAGQPRRFAAWLRDRDLAVPLFGAGGLPRPAQRVDGYGVVLGALPKRVRRHFGAQVVGWADPVLEQIQGKVDAGDLEAARREWAAVAAEPSRGPAWAADIECLRGDILKREGRVDEAIAAYRAALTVAQDADLVHFEADLLLRLAGLLRDNGRWLEAEPLFREALRLEEEGGATPTSRGITLDELARGLRDNGRWTEAEPLFREALRLAEEGGDTPTSRGITLDYLARGLRDNGRWGEAEPLFREALRLKEEGGATPTSCGITLHELARGLRDNGRWAEAEPMFREALRLREEGGDAPTSRGVTLHELARGLRDNGRWVEAEPLFRKALRLAEEGGDTPTSRGITLAELALGLRDNGRWGEAEPLFREALRLAEEGGDTPTSRGVTLHELARGLRDNKRTKEARATYEAAIAEYRKDGSEFAEQAEAELARLKASWWSR